jgi:C1A family cysteine protease
LVQKYNEREFEEDESDDEDKHILELNKFADLTQEEYKKMLGFRPNLSETLVGVESLNGKLSDLPDSIDWAAKGVVTPIKNQGTCGSCWAFSTTGSIESAYWIKNGSEVLLSEQQLVDCSISYGNNGCGGGLVEYGYNYAKHVALETEAQYPYHAKDDKCAQKE